MSYTEINKKRYECKCQATKKDGSVCGYEWESDKLPRRCASCKSSSWNGATSKYAKITHLGQSLTVKEWAVKLGLKPQTIRQRMFRGYSVEDCLYTRKFIPGRTPKGDA